MIYGDDIEFVHFRILFLDKIAEFNKKTLDALKQPMKDGKVTIARVKIHIYFLSLQDLPC